jgi:Putative MetA-pathway of phenol degradation
MIRGFSLLLLPLLLAVAIVAAAQQLEISTETNESASADDPVANPGRPTVSTPATLTPVGYFQLETGFLAAWHSPGLASQPSLNEVIKFSVSRWIQLLAGAEPFAHSRAEGQSTNGAGDVALGVQAVVHHGEGAQPTIAVGYFGRVHSGDAPDLDIGSFKSSALVLASADVKGFHCDTNYLFNEVSHGAIRRAQFGQTLSVSHSVGKKFGISGEIWRFTQPFLRSNAVGGLWALNYNVRKYLVLDGGFNRGLTSTSTRWEVFAGFTYLLPHKVSLH